MKLKHLMKLLELAGQEKYGESDWSATLEADGTIIVTDDDGIEMFEGDLDDTVEYLLDTISGDE